MNQAANVNGFGGAFHHREHVAIFDLPDRQTRETGEMAFTLSPSGLAYL